MIDNELNELYQTLSTILKQYAVPKDPLTPSIINSFKDELDNLNDSIKKIDEEYEKYKENNKEKAKEFQKKYLDKIELLTKNKNKNIEINIDYVHKKLDEINKENNELKTNNDNNTKEHLMEIEWFKVSNEQSFDSIEKDMNDSSARLLYQLETAKNSYREYVEEHNNDYSDKKEKNIQKYEQEKIKYDEESSKLLSMIDDEIKKLNTSLENENNILEGIKKQQNEVRRNNTVEINAKVRTLVNEKNQYVLGERFGYTKYHSINRVELEFRRKEIQSNIQLKSREYMRKVGKLETENNKIKAEYQNIRDSIEREYQLYLLSNKNKEELEIKNFLASSSDVKAISKINKFYSSKNKQEKKKRDKALRETEKKYKSKLITNDFIRQKLDINREYDNKINSEMEAKENKYYQELNNIDENDFRFKSKFYNIDYANKANKIKLDNNLQMLKLESKYDKINSQHQIEIEKLSNQLRKLNIEYETLVNIENKVKDIEERRHIKNLQYIAIINMLEIEKAKLLNEYNKSNYDLNVLDINNSLKFSKNSIELQNERKNKENHIIIEIENKECEKKINENNNKITWLTDELEFKIKKLDQEYNYNIEALLNDLFYKKFLLESKAINQIITTVAIISKISMNSINTAINTVFNNVYIRPEHIHNIRELFSRLYIPLEVFYDKIISKIRNEVDEIVSDRNDLALEFKFKSNYTQIQAEYNNSYDSLKNELNEINNRINSLNISIDRSNQARFSISNHLSKIKSNKKNKEVRDNLLSSLYKYDTEIVNLNNKLIDAERTKSELEKRIEIIKEEKDKTDKEVQNLKSEAVIVYTDLQKNLDYMILNQVKFKPNLLNDDTEITYDNYDDFVDKKCNDVMNYTNDMIIKLYDIYNIFVEKSVITNKKNIESTESFNDRSSAKLNKELNIAMAEMKEKNANERHKFNSELNVLRNKHASILRENDEKVRILNKKRNDEFKEQYKIKNIIDTKFHNEFYALKSNQEAIVNDYNNTFINLINESKDYKKQLIAEKDVQYKNIDNSFNKYYSDKNEFIKELPRNLRNDEKEIIKENLELSIINKKQKVIDRQKFFRTRTNHFKNIFILNNSYSAKIRDLNRQRRLEIKKEKRRLHLKLKRA